jgi:hypothetical protein
MEVPGILWRSAPQHGVRPGHTRQVVLTIGTWAACSQGSVSFLVARQAAQAATEYVSACVHSVSIRSGSGLEIQANFAPAGTGPARTINIHSYAVGLQQHSASARPWNCLLPPCRGPRPAYYSTRTTAIALGSKTNRSCRSTGQEQLPLLQEPSLAPCSAPAARAGLQPTRWHGRAQPPACGELEAAAAGAREQG